MNTVGIYLSFLRSGFDWAPDRYFLYSAERFRLRQVARHQAQKGKDKDRTAFGFLGLAIPFDLPIATHGPFLRACH